MVAIFLIRPIFTHGGLESEQEVANLFDEGAWTAEIDGAMAAGDAETEAVVGATTGGRLSAPLGLDYALPGEDVGVGEDKGEGRMRWSLWDKIEVFQWDTLCAAQPLTPDWVAG